MCRICGIVDFNKSLSKELEAIAISMRDVMIHGGPDDSGIYLNQNKTVALANRRLSIIDLSYSGHQPMSNKAKNIWITYNGEIYNFQELKNELVNRGYSFYSKTDTEVLINGYEEWGIEGLLLRLRGMFAFAIYDLRQNISSTRLILARDRIGIKPLYYYRDKEKFIFASEVKAIIKSRLLANEINSEAIVRFLQLGSVPTPLTTIKNVFSLPAGHYMIVDENICSIKQYWDLLNYLKSSDTTSFEESLAYTKVLLQESTKLHLISDAPLGVFLSGGVDSSSLVAIASHFQDKPLKTLSIIFEDKRYDETPYSREIANLYKTEHHEVLLKQDDFFEELPQIFEAMDQPTIDGVNTYFVSKAAKEIGLKVVLSGIGGDEVFLGYDYFKRINSLRMSQMVLKGLPSFMRKVLINGCLSIEEFIGEKVNNKLSYMIEPSAKNNYLLFRGLFTPNEIHNLIGVDCKELEALNIFPQLTSETNNYLATLSIIQAFSFFDFKHYLQNQLLKDADFMGMRHSIEIRVPFLDHMLLEKVISFNSHVKLRNGKNKPLLVKAMEGDLPKSVYNRKKMGFVFPFGEWINGNWKDIKDICLSNDDFNYKFVQKIWGDFRKGKMHWSRVWALVVLSYLKSNAKQGVSV